MCGISSGPAAAGASSSLAANTTPMPPPPPGGATSATTGTGVGGANGAPKGGVSPLDGKVPAGGEVGDVVASLRSLIERIGALTEQLGRSGSVHQHSNGRGKGHTKGRGRGHRPHPGQNPLQSALGGAACLAGSRYMPQPTSWRRGG